MGIVDHLGISVTDYEKSRAFYDKALAPLGITRLAEFDTPGGKVVGYGRDKPEFWFSQGTGMGGPTHVAFGVEDRATVDAFYAAAIEAGGTDNGAPGPRPIYHDNYYGAFVLDPDGYNIEAVCHKPA